MWSGRGLVCDDMKVSEPEPQPATGKDMSKGESIATFARLRSVSIFRMLILPCTFLLF